MDHVSFGELNILCMNFNPQGFESRDSPCSVQRSLTILMATYIPFNNMLSLPSSFQHTGNFAQKPISS
jgi:hypothetical protein